MITTLEPVPPPTTPHLLLFPTEILNEIIKWFINEPGKSSLRSLCLTSGLLREIAQPFLLKEITIGIPVGHDARHFARLESLATGNSVASLYARTLVIGAFYSLKVTTIDHLKSALRSFRFVRKVVWYPGPYDDQEISKCIRDGLSFIVPEELSIELVIQPKVHRVPRPRTVNSNTYSSLRKILEELIPTFPQLRSLEVNAKDVNLFIPAAYTHTNLSQIEHLALKWTDFSSEGLQLMIHHLPNLKSLSFRALAYSGILYPEGTPHPSQLWNTLKGEGVYLTKISTDTWTDTHLISYLESYEGLEHLTLEFLDLDRSFRDQSQMFGPQELLAALSGHHANSLTKLGIRAEYGQRPKWSVPEICNAEFETLLRSLTKLQEIELTLGRFSDSNFKTLIRFFDDSFPSLEHLQFITPYFAKVRREAEFPHFDHHHSIVELSDCLHRDDVRHRQIFKSIMEYPNVKLRNTPTKFSIVVGTSTFNFRDRMASCVEIHNSIPGDFVRYFSWLMNRSGVEGQEVQDQKLRMRTLFQIFRSEPGP